MKVAPSCPTLCDPVDYTAIDTSAYDIVCAEMLDLVFEGLIFDFGLMYSNNINLKTDVLLKSIYETEDIVGLYKGKETAAETNIANLFNSVEILD